jgi:uncharacterized MAPEG superfamily protein
MFPDARLDSFGARRSSSAFPERAWMMTLANWMVLVAALLPFPTVLIAKAGAGFDNTAPRAYLDGLTGYRQRADWAHRNHFETFPAFAAAVILAQMAGASQGRIDTLAVAFILLRVAYTGAYLANTGGLRSALYGLSMGCVIWLFVLPF